MAALARVYLVHADILGAWRIVKNILDAGDHTNRLPDHNSAVLETSSQLDKLALGLARVHEKAHPDYLTDMMREAGVEKQMGVDLVERGAAQILAKQ